MNSSGFPFWSSSTHATQEWSWRSISSMSGAVTFFTDFEREKFKWRKKTMGFCHEIKNHFMLPVDMSLHGWHEIKAIEFVLWDLTIWKPYKALQLVSSPVSMQIKLVSWLPSSPAAAWKDKACQCLISSPEEWRSIAQSYPPWGKK